MLDAFIIERIRREQRQERGAHIPLRIEVPLPPLPEARPRQSHAPEEKDPHLVDFSI